MEHVPTWASLGLRIGDEARAWCLTYSDIKPILTLHGGELSVSLCPSDRDSPVSEAELRFARELVTQARSYLAELERLAHVHTASANEPGAT
ncbi:hypothetical protein F4561_004570 [Lipingzhangella halophila]|uniref:Uncharacterized protein n=1 Tax=Lipingzhangella halophila TaxID=1783352 RepID=A0A7W7W5G7_9ACTN|nr:hypothetical protein [Lipingzhangella halophila]MBB4933750.1 hypothetical protein [Lipingzhangella halophila]